MAKVIMEEVGNMEMAVLGIIVALPTTTQGFSTKEESVTPTFIRKGQHHTKNLVLMCVEVALYTSSHPSSPL